MPERDTMARDDRELRLVVNTLQRLALRVESRFNPDVNEGADVADAIEDDELVDYARRCLAVLDDPALISRLRARPTPRW